MNNQLEIAFSKHIGRLEKAIAEREADNPWHQELTKVDAKNIASLREGRIPVYGDHMSLTGNIEMFEFADLTILRNAMRSEELGESLADGYLKNGFTPFAAS